MIFFCTRGSPPSHPPPSLSARPVWPCGRWGVGWGESLGPGGSRGEAWLRSRCVRGSVVMKTGSAARWESAAGDETRGAECSSDISARKGFAAAAAAYLLIRGGVHHDVLLLPVGCNDPSRQWSRWRKREKCQWQYAYVLGRFSSGEKRKLTFTGPVL